MKTAYWSITLVVTSNVAKMWEDYAKSIGVTTASLTQAQKIEAEYQGILEETMRFQVGRRSHPETLAGAQAEAAMSGELLSKAYGDSNGADCGCIDRKRSAFQNTLKDAVETFPGLTAGVTAGRYRISCLRAQWIPCCCHFPLNALKFEVCRSRCWELHCLGLV